MADPVWTNVATAARKATGGDMSIPISGLSNTDCIVIAIGRSVNTTVGAAGISAILQTSTAGITIPLITHLSNTTPAGTIELHVLRVDATQALTAQSITIKVNQTENTIYDIWRVSGLGDVDTAKLTSKAVTTASQQAISDVVNLSPTGVGVTFAEWALHPTGAQTINNGLTFVSVVNSGSGGGDIGPQTIMAGAGTSGGSAATNSGMAGVRSGPQPANGANSQLQGSVGWSATATFLLLTVDFKVFGQAQPLQASAAGSSTVAANATPVHFNQLVSNASPNKPIGQASVTGSFTITPAIGDDPLFAQPRGTSTVTAQMKSLGAGGTTALRASPAGSATARVARYGTFQEQAMLPVGAFGWTFSSGAEFPAGDQRVTSNVPSDRGSAFGGLPQEYWKALWDSPYGRRIDSSNYDDTRYGVVDIYQNGPGLTDQFGNEYTVDNRKTRDSYQINLYLNVFTIWKYTLALSAPANIPRTTFPLNVNFLVTIGPNQYASGVRYQVGLRLYEVGGTFDTGQVNTDLPAAYFGNPANQTVAWLRAYFPDNGQQVSNWANLRLEISINSTVGFGGQQDIIYLYGFQVWAPLGTTTTRDGEVVISGSSSATGAMTSVANQKRLTAAAAGVATVTGQSKFQLKQRATISTTATVSAALTRTSPSGAKALAGTPAGVATVMEIRRVLLAATPVGTSSTSAALRLTVLKLRATVAALATVTAQLRESLRLGSATSAGDSTTSGLMFSGKPAPLYGSPVVGYSNVVAKVTISQGKASPAPAAFAPQTTKSRATRVPLLGQ